MAKRTLTLRRPKRGGQVEGVVAISAVVPYTEVFSSVDDAREFAEKYDLEVIGPPGDEDVPPP